MYTQHVIWGAVLLVAILAPLVLSVVFDTDIPKGFEKTRSKAKE